MVTGAAVISALGCGFAEIAAGRLLPRALVARQPAGYPRIIGPVRIRAAGRRTGSDAACLSHGQLARDTGI